MCEVLQQPERPPAGGPDVEPPPARRLDSEQDVLGDGEVRAERELLMDEGDAAPPRLERRGRGVGPIVELHLAAVRMQRAGDDAHQRALAGAVLPDQGVHLAGVEHQVHAVQRHRRAEPLGEARDPEHAHCSMR